MEEQHSPWVKQISTWPLLALVAVLSFSYHPLVSFGSVYGTHLDGSLLYVIVALAAIGSAPIVWKQRNTLKKSKSLLWLIGFTLFSLLSVAWSANPVRGVITAAFSSLLVLLVCTVAINLPLMRHHQQSIYRLVIAGSTVSVLWALWQVYGDAFGVDSAFTLLTPAYESTVFGAARPTGFALEPQFFASFLLIPFFWLSVRLVSDNLKNAPLHYFGITALSTILVLSLSRGALFAAALGLILLLVLHHPSLKRWLYLGATVFGGVVVAGVITFSAATINQRDSISGYTSLAKSLNHLSLGIISLPPEHRDVKVGTPKVTTPPKATSGYVTASTDSRLSMSAQAILLWTENPQHFLFGIGNGSFGTTLHAKDNRYPTNSIVNNYYLELVVETGLIGLSLFVAFFVGLLYKLFKARNTLLIVIITSLLVQACFFSGNANIIHLWIIFGLALGVSLSQTKKPLHLVQ